MTKQITEIQIGKMLPQAQDLEKSVLSTCLRFKYAYPQAADILKPEHFHRPQHQAIFAAMCTMYNSGSEFDALLLTEELKKKGTLELAGGVSYLQNLMRFPKFSQRVDAHSKIIVERFIARNGIENLSQVVGDFYNLEIDVFETVEKADQWISNINTIGPGSKPVDLDVAADDLINKIEDYFESGIDTPPGLLTGFRDLDATTNGLQPGDFVILAARPAMGKTAMALNVARNIAEGGKGVAVFSLEMSTAQLTGRVLSGESQINGQKMRNYSKLNPQERKVLKESRDKFRDWDMKICDDAGASMGKIRAKSREIKREFARKGKTLDAVIIDYLQLIGNDPGGKRNTNREQDVSQISRACKMLAKEMGIPVIALSQLSRAVETRGGDKRPQLSDLRESGSLEQDADMVMFLYRAEYYKIEEDEQGNSLKGIAELIIAKNRSGETKDIPLRFISDFADFRDLDMLDFDLLPEADENKGKWKGSGIEDTTRPVFQPVPANTNTENVPF